MLRRESTSPDADPPPRRLRPILGFRGRRLAGSTLSTVLDVLDHDDAVRGRVAAEATEAAVGRPGWLFLHRPTGWREDLARLVEEERERRSRVIDEVEERTALRRTARLEQVVADLRSRLADAETGISRGGEAVEAERVRRRTAESGAADLERRLQRAVAERDAALGDLARAREDARRLRSELEVIEDEVARLREERGTWSGPALRAVDRSRSALTALSGAIEEASRLLAAAGGRTTGDAWVAGPDDVVGASVEARTAPEVPPGERPARRGRRTPIRLARGALDGSVEATDQVLRTAGIVVLVDGYNVSMEGWPHLGTRMQRERLVSLLGDVAARTGADVRVVFDGVEEGSRPTVGAAMAVRVQFTASGVEADDVLIGMVADLPATTPVAVVSSDRRVRDAAGAGGANLVASAALLAWERR